MENINKSYTSKMREGWSEIYVSKPIWQNSLLEQSWAFAVIEAQQYEELPLIQCLLKQMYQECSMRVKKVADSPMFCDKSENTSLFM